MSKYAVRSLVRVCLFAAVIALVFEPAAFARTVNARYGGKFEIDSANFHVYDIPIDRFEELTGIPRSLQSPEPRLAERAQKAPAATGKVLTLLIEWENHLATQFFHPAVAYDSLLYSDGVYPTGSVRDYYQEVSYGAFSVTGEVAGWLSMPEFYNGWYDIEAVIAAADPLINFADYDGDGDGNVDALWIIHAGPGQEETHDVNDIWSHAYRGANVPTDDGVIVERWSVQPEEHANGAIITIRVFCHEYGHILGLPDLYDYDAKLDTVTYFTPNDDNDHPVNDWDVMGYAGYDIMSYGNRACPSHFCAWSRIQLGFAAAQTPTCYTGAFQLYNIEEHSTQSIFKVPISEDGTEYFLLEYRNPRSGAQFDHVNSDFSAYCPWFTPGPDTLDQGLLITHIDDLMPPNDGQPFLPHYAVAVVDAGYKPSQPWNGTEFTEWWYPYEFQVGALYSPDDAGQTHLSATTSPSSDGYSGPSRVEIIVTGQNADFMTVIIDKYLAPEFAPIAPITVAAGDSINVGVFATDPNCTTPGLSPLMLPPFVTLWDSGGGHGALILEPQPADIGVSYARIRATDGGLWDSITVQITVTPPSCTCPCAYDPQCDGTVSNSQDVVVAINVAFRGIAGTIDAGCPYQRTDVDADGSTNSVDVVRVINVAFRGQSATLNYTPPCP